MSVKLGDLIDGLSTLKDIYGSGARILSVDDEDVFYTHSSDVLIEDFKEDHLNDMMSAGWRWNEYYCCWEIQL